MCFFLLKGLIIGFCIAAPVGPIGVLCINRSLRKGFLSGFFTGLGAAVADGVYGIIAGFGLTIVANFLLHEQHWIKAIGGLFLIYLGITTWRSQPANKEATTKKSSDLIADFTSTFFLTLTNPMTILSFIAVFAGLGLVTTPHNTVVQAVLLVFGVVLGSLCWWLVLSSFVACLLKHSFSPVFMKWINRVSGAILLIFGGGALITLI